MRSTQSRYAGLRRIASEPPLRSTPGRTTLDTRDGPRDVERHAVQRPHAAGELLRDVDDADGGPAAAPRRRDGRRGGRAVGHAGRISGRNRRCSARWSSVTLTLATTMIDRIEANIRGESATDR